MRKHARYETYDREVDLDELRMTTHPGRAAGQHNGPWYGDIAIPANTAYLALSELSLARMATILGDHTMAERRRARYTSGRHGYAHPHVDRSSGLLPWRFIANACTGSTPNSGRLHAANGARAHSFAG